MKISNFNQNSMKTFLTQFFILLLFSCQLFAGERGLKTFTFVHMSDTQLGFGGYEHDLKSFEQAVKKINELNPDFVLICGDLVNSPSDTAYIAFKRIKEKFKMPCYCVPGNHDVDDTTSLVSYRKTIGKDYYSFRHKGCSFIVTNTQLWKKYTKGDSEKFDQWFAEEIRKYGKKSGPLFVAGHIPLFILDSEEPEEYYNIAPEKRKRILNLFVQNKVAAYLTGHTHKLICNGYLGIQMVCSETTSVNFDKRPLGFRLWTVSAESISHQFVPVEK